RNDSGDVRGNRLSSTGVMSRSHIESMIASCVSTEYPAESAGMSMMKSTASPTLRMPPIPETRYPIPALPDRRRLLVGLNSGIVSIVRDRAIHQRGWFAGGETARMIADANDAVVTPDVRGIAIEKVQRLHLAPGNDGEKRVFHRLRVLDAEHDTIGRLLQDAQLIDRLAREIVGLFKEDGLAVPHLIRREVRSRVGILLSFHRGGFHDQRLPHRVRRRPVPHP